MMSDSLIFSEDPGIYTNDYTIRHIILSFKQTYCRKIVPQIGTG